MLFNYCKKKWVRVLKFAKENSCSDDPLLWIASPQLWRVNGRQSSADWTPVVLQATSYKRMRPQRLAVSCSSSISAAPCARLVIFSIFCCWINCWFYQKNVPVFILSSVIIEVITNGWRCSFQGNHKTRASSSSSSRRRRCRRNIYNSRVNRPTFRTLVPSTRKVTTTITTDLMM